MEQKKVKLVLIDGHAILHRAFHALPPMTNKDGMQTNAVYGFVTMLLRILENLKPTHLAVAFDRPEPTFRMQQYTAYQAKRPEMQGNLVEQIPLVHKLLDELKIAYFEVVGFEADDCIGTLAVQATNIQKTRRTQKTRISDKSDRSDDQKFRLSEFSDSSDISEVIIVTGDRDMLQLVNKKVKVCAPVKGLAETKIYDEKLIWEEFGVRPDQWVDVKALKGDASDNYPGVRGIGPKTAQDLIAKFGTLENLYKNLKDLDSKLRLKLAEGAEGAGMGKKLAQIMTDVPVHLDLEKAEVTGVDWNLGVKYMREELGFKSIPDKIERLHGLVTTDNTETKKEKAGEQLGLI